MADELAHIQQTLETFIGPIDEALLYIDSPYLSLGVNQPQQ